MAECATQAWYERTDWQLQYSVQALRTRAVPFMICLRQRPDAVAAFFIPGSLTTDAYALFCRGDRYFGVRHSNSIGTVHGGTLRRHPDTHHSDCLLYTSDAADDLLCVDLGGRRIIK